VTASGGGGEAAVNPQTFGYGATGTTFSPLPTVPAAFTAFPHHHLPSPETHSAATCGTAPAVCVRPVATKPQCLVFRRATFKRGGTVCCYRSRAGKTAADLRLCRFTTYPPPYLPLMALQTPCICVTCGVSYIPHSTGCRADISPALPTPHLRYRTARRTARRLPLPVHFLPTATTPSVTAWLLHRLPPQRPIPRVRELVLYHTASFLPGDRAYRT